MAYSKQTFTDNVTVLTAAMMNHIEDGIVSVETAQGNFALRKGTTHIEYTTNGSSWNQLVALADIKGEKVTLVRLELMVLKVLKVIKVIREIQGLLVKMVLV